MSSDVFRSNYLVSKKSKMQIYSLVLFSPIFVIPPPSLHPANITYPIAEIDLRKHTIFKRTFYFDALFPFQVLGMNDRRWKEEKDKGKTRRHLAMTA